MLKTKGWVTEPVREALLAKLNGDAEVRRESDRKIHNVVDDNKSGFVIEIPDATEMPPDFHPSSTWVLLPRHTNPRQNTPKESVGTIFDVDGRIQRDYKTGLADFRAAKFVLGGTAVLFGDKFHTARLVPFANGKLEFSKAEHIGEPTDKR